MSEQYVHALIKKAAEQQVPDASMKLAQAALNAAQALQTLAYTKLVGKEEPK